MNIFKLILEVCFGLGMLSAKSLRCRRVGNCCAANALDTESCKSKTCQRGFTRIKCDVKCPFPTFGNESQRKCKCDFGSCDHIHGCIEKKDCSKGFFGVKCERNCPYPTFGKDCQMKCNCSKTFCSPIRGCKDKFQYLSELIPKSITILEISNSSLLFHLKNFSTDFKITALNPNEAHKGNVLLIITVSLNVTFIVILACVATSCCVKKRRLQLLNVDDKLMTSSKKQKATFRENLIEENETSLQNVSRMNETHAFRNISQNVMMKTNVQDFRNMTCI